MILFYYFLFFVIYFILCYLHSQWLKIRLIYFIPIIGIALFIYDFLENDDIV